MTHLRLLSQPASDLAEQSRAVILHGEGACTEFKTSFQKEVIETLAAFANTKGGLVLVGVNDASQIVGIEIKAETLQGWINQCKQNTSPSVIPDIEVVEIDGKTIAIISVDEYPVKPVAYIREIVINMIVHRDYRSANDSTIKIFDDHIEFFNPGVLLDDLTIEKIKTGNYKSHLRNKQIASIFKELELIEKYGSGVQRVIETFIAYGLPEPVYEVTQGGMAVTVFKVPVESKIKGVNGGVNGGVNSLLSYVQTHPGQRASEMAAALNLSQRTIERWLKQLKGSNKIEFRGVPKTGGYHKMTESKP